MSGLEHVAVFTRHRSPAKAIHADALQLAWNEDGWKKLLVCTDPRPFRAGDVVIQRGASDRAV